MLRDPLPHHHVRQRLDHLRASPAYPPLDSDGQASGLLSSALVFPRNLVQQRQKPQRSSIVRSGADKIIAPDVVPMLRPQSHTGTAVQPEPSSGPLFLRHFQTFPPPDSLHPILPHRPARALQQRRDSSTDAEPYRPYCAARATTARVSSSSSNRSIGRYRCVPLHAAKSGPSSRQARRSDRPYFPRAHSTAQRRRSGLRSFPGLRPVALASPATTRPPVASTQGRSTDVVPMLRPQSHTGTAVQPEPSSGPLFLRHFQTFPPPDSLHPILPTGQPELCSNAVIRR